MAYVYHQIVFGVSNIMGDIGYAIEGAFDCILRMEECINSELRMVRDVSFEVMCDAENIQLARDMLIPSREKKAVCNTSYGVFLGYSLGLGKDYGVAVCPLDRTEEPVGRFDIAERRCSRAALFT